MRLVLRSLSLSLLCSLVLAGCNDPAPVDDDDAGTETGDPTTGDGDPTTGDGDGDPTTGDGDGDGDDALVDWPTLDCDPLVPDFCAFPYPNNVFSAADPATPTGRRLALSEAMMPKTNIHTPATDSFNMSDGFSPSSTVLAFLPGAATTGLVDPLNIADSLAPDSPTIILDAETGELVPHWAELDMSHGDDGRRAFMLRPARRFDPDTRYIVAIREVVDQDGVALPPSEGFAALRDGTASEDPAIEARRPLYVDIFDRLAAAGIAREDLQLAWDFTTASTENLTERALTVRDAGLAALPADGPDYSIDNVTMDPAPGIAMRLELTITVPLFLDSPEAGGALVYGADGLPEQNGTAEYPVLVHVPYAAYDAPAKLMAYGHGMLGSRWEISAGHLEALAAASNVIVFATDWVGMAQDDVDNIVGILATGRIDEFHTVPDRLQQGFLNAFAAMRLIQGKLADDPIMQGVNVDPEDPWYFGASQGGIFGSCYMALSPDVPRGVLAVPGQPYNLLLNRSVNFAEFFDLIDGAYPDKLDLRFLIELVQLEWDRAEPSGYSRHIVHDPLPGTEAKEVLLLVSIGDHQVTTLGAHVMAREIGVPQLGPANRPDLFGIDVVEQPYMGSAVIEYDFGLPPEPIENVPMTAGEDPHSKLAEVPAAALTVEQFLRTGVAESFCDGACDPD